MNAPHILVVDDEPSVLNYTKTWLELNNCYHIETAASGEEVMNRMQRGPAPNLILLDLVMPGMDGLQVLERCRKIRPEQKVVMLSCVSETSKVVQAMKLGAADYITKPFEGTDLHGAIRRALESDSRAVGKTPAAEEAPVVEELDDDLFFLALSPTMKQLRAQVALVAKVDVPVLLLGESGVGKEVLARLIHKMSVRSHRSLLKVNCAALPADLLESELFGYEAGAFTGAHKPKPGKFELCNKGTILLDEIGEMSAPLQAKLLHVLQDGEFSRLGGRANVQVDVRVLAATNIDVERAIAERRLREDLYFRLNAFTMKIPPLRERREEIPLLLKHFMSRLAVSFGANPLPMPDRIVQECLRYHWPGNLRELGNFAKRYLVLKDEDMILDELRLKALEGPQSAAMASSSGGGLKGLVKDLKSDAECKAIQRALEEAAWNRKLAAAKLNISYKALLYKIKQYGILPPSSAGRESRMSGLSTEQSI